MLAIVRARTGIATLQLTRESSTKWTNQCQTMVVCSKGTPNVSTWVHQALTQFLTTIRPNSEWACPWPLITTTFTRTISRTTPVSFLSNNAKKLTCNNSPSTQCLIKRMKTRSQFTRLMMARRSITCRGTCSQTCP